MILSNYLLRLIIYNHFLANFFLVTLIFSDFDITKTPATLIRAIMEELASQTDHVCVHPIVLDLYVNFAMVNIDFST